MAGVTCVAAGLWGAQPVGAQLGPATGRAHAASALEPFAADTSALHPPPRTRPRPLASYTLSARLDAQTHRVAGQGSIRFTNASQQPTSELWLHLYLNAFKNNRTLFLRSPFGAGRRGLQAGEWGYIDVKRLSVREFGNTDIWPTAAGHSPGDAEDQTDIRVALPAAVQPGQSITLDVQFESQLPELVERTGYSETFHFVAQWFPKLARRLPTGAWVHFPFHPQGEFCADFGDYSVSIDVPESMRVAATGPRVEERVAQGRRVVRHHIRGVHDFAWAAWDGFQERRERIGQVDVRLLFPHGHEHNAELSLESLRFALPHFSHHYGSYPYGVLTVVHPPEHAGAAGGMEYPTLITTGGAWYVGYLARVVEAVTIHELAHQWFYGLVATDEHAWPFLDEGLTSFAEGLALRERYGAGSLVDLPGLQIATEAVGRWLAVARGQDDAIAQPASAFSGLHSLSALVYARTAALLRTLCGAYTQEAVLRALGRYAREHRFGHPGPEQLLDAVRAELGVEAAETLRIGLFERGWVDYRVHGLRNARRSPAAGVFDRAGGRETPPRPAEADAMDWVGAATVVRRGTLRLPVDIELTAEDGSRTRRHWNGHGAWLRVEHSGSSPLARVVVDPDRRIAIDENLLNNAISARPAPSRRTTERAVYVAQLLLGWFGP
jgi:hypothetical protein